MNSNINDVRTIAEVLSELGYEVVEGDNIVSTRIGGEENAFPVVLTISGDQLKIDCQVAKSGQIVESKAADFAWAALDANTRIVPFALGILTSSDDPSHDNEDEWPIVLTDTIPLGDLSRSELEYAMDGLEKAIFGIKDVLRLGLTE